MTDAPDDSADSTQPAIDPARAAADLERLLRLTVERLEASGARDEALGEVRLPRGFGPFKTSVQIAPVGRAWRLGILLVTSDARLFRVGRITRATETGRPQSLSLSVEQRRAERVAATKGHFAEGEVVNFEYEAIALDPESLARGDGSLSIDGSRVVLAWNSPGDRRDLAAYLDEMFVLLFDS
jgi:hypothetical protein